VLSCWLTDSRRVTVRPQASQAYSYRGMADPPWAEVICMVLAPRGLVKLLEENRGRALRAVGERPTSSRPRPEVPCTRSGPAVLPGGWGGGLVMGRPTRRGPFHSL